MTGILGGFLGSAGAGSTGVTSLTFVTSSQSNTATITIPATAQVGDIAVLVQGSHNTSATIPTLVVPSGWTTAATHSVSSGFGIIGNIAYKILTSGEPGSTITGISSGSTNKKGLVVFRPSASVSNITLSTPSGEATSGDPAVQTIPLSAATAPMIALAHTYSTATPTITQSPVGEMTNAFGTVGSLNFYRKIYTSSNANITIDMNDAGVNVLQSLYMQVS